MKTILCYGDSNTFGADPEVMFGRFDYETRWTGRLQRLLGPDYDVIEEGLGGRTTVLDDPLTPGRNGGAFLPVCLESHSPMDLVILMLGTNDFKLRFHMPAGDTALGLRNLISTIRQAASGEIGQVLFGGKCPEILLMAPVRVGENIEAGPFGPMFGRQAIEKSNELAGLLKTLAAEMGCHFFDAGSVAGTGADSLHIHARGHAALAEALAKQVREILG